MRTRQTPQRRLLMTAMLVVVATIAVALGSASDASAQRFCEKCVRLTSGQIAQTLPQPDDFPVAKLGLASGLKQDATSSVDACADGKDGQVAPTRRWATLVLSGGSRRSLEITAWSFGRTIDARWREAVQVARDCGPEYPLKAPNGTPGVIRQRLISISDTAIQLTAVVRSATSTSSLTVVVSRADDAIQTALVRRVGLPTDADLALARRGARIARDRYVAARVKSDAVKPVVGVAAAPAAWTESTLNTIPAGTPVAVSLGDSFISGEAGRWRGNVGSSSNASLVDLGASAYWDTPTGESEVGCHRSTSAEVHMRGMVGINLACSGAITTSKVSSDGTYKPGIDDGMVVNGTKRYGQLTLLDAVARRANVKLVVLSIGGNDLGFTDVMTACVIAFAKPWPFSSNCKDDPAVQAPFSDAGLATVGQKVQGAIQRIHITMAAAGYKPEQWKLIVQSYPMPISTEARYPETYWGRFVNGGCPFYDADVAWIGGRMPAFAGALRDAAARASAATGHAIQFMDLTTAFQGRTLCSKYAGFVDELPEGAARTDSAERVQMMRFFSPWVKEEAVHPNALGQRALSVCLEQAWNGGATRSGACAAPTAWAQVDPEGLPRMVFTPAG